MDDIQANYVRQHSHGGSHVKGSNKESVSLFSLPVAPVCLPVVSGSQAEKQSIKKKEKNKMYYFHHLNFLRYHFNVQL